jgi:succinate-semialdehyde dehydrogenase/glutarate-semialdehyde dehydrogenase
MLYSSVTNLRATTPRQQERRRHDQHDAGERRPGTIQPSTIGGVAGAPTPSRADRLVARVAGGEDAAPVQMRAPFTGMPIATLPQATDADARAVFAGARRAQQIWAARPVTERQRVLNRLHDLVLDRQAEALDLVQVEAGKARIDAFDEVSEPHLSPATTANTARKSWRRGAAPG